MIEKYKKAFDIAQPYLLLDGTEGTLKNREPDLDKLNEALFLCEEVVDECRSAWGAYWLKGKIHQVLDEGEKAYLSFKQAYAIAKQEEPEKIHGCILRELAWVCLCGNQFEEAEYYTRLAIEFEDDPGLLSNHALALIMQGDHNLAKEYLSRAIDQGDQGVQETAEKLLALIEAIQIGKYPQPKTYQDLFELDPENL